jgi:hypothetical protein
MESLITIRSREDGLLSDSDPPVELSTQYFIDYFANKYGNKGFKVARLGLNMMCVMDFLETHGIPLEEDYPFKGFNEHDMEFSKCKAKMYRIDDYWFMEKPNQFQIMKKLVHQPLIAAVDPSKWYNDHTWKKDVIHRAKTSKYDYCLTHDILIVGYGESKGIPFWVVRDSNGIGCGMGGYLKIHRGSNSFGIEQEIYYLIIKKAY